MTASVKILFVGKFCIGSFCFIKKDKEIIPESVRYIWNGLLTLPVKKNCTAKIKPYFSTLKEKSNQSINEFICKERFDCSAVSG